MQNLPQNILKPTVAIGTLYNGKFVTNATGFLIAKKITINGVRKIYIFLITNRHVINNKENKIEVRFGKLNRTIYINDKNWKISLDVDLAVCMLESELINDKEMWKQIEPEQLLLSFDCDDHIITSETMLKKSIGPGHELFVSGFPLGIAGDERNFPIVRGGIIARFDQEILKKRKKYFIDVAIHPGNSGGFVFLKIPTHNLRRSSTFYVCGVIFASVLKKEILYENRNGKWVERMILLESIDLGEVIPMEYVKESIDSLIKNLTIN